MARRRKTSRQESAPSRPAARRGLEPHLLGTMFDRSETVERVLSNGTVVRLRVEDLGEGRVMVHEARRKRGEGQWARWREVEGEQRSSDLGLEKSTRLGSWPFRGR